MENLPHCPKCNSEYTYEDRNLLICPECFHEWVPDAESENKEKVKLIKDSNGNVLKDGDTKPSAWILRRGEESSQRQE